MLQAVVVGNVWSTKRIAGLPSGAFLEVEVTGSGDRLVAFDILGSGRGERVLVAQGSVASGWLPDRPPVDALIIGSIDEPVTKAEPSRPSEPPAPAPSQPKTGRKRRGPPASQ
jgi:ethanolamine utilization protein EutN